MGRQVIKIEKDKKNTSSLHQLLLPFHLFPGDSWNQLRTQSKGGNVIIKRMDFENLRQPASCMCGSLWLVDVMVGDHTLRQHQSR
jgi:hypothetical protein